MGFSLGARVIFSCLETLAKQGEKACKWWNAQFVSLKAVNVLLLIVQWLLQLGLSNELSFSGHLFHWISNVGRLLER